MAGHLRPLDVSNVLAVRSRRRVRETCRSRRGSGSRPKHPRIGASRQQLRQKIGLDSRCSRPCKLVDRWNSQRQADDCNERGLGESIHGENSCMPTASSETGSEKRVSLCRRDETKRVTCCFYNVCGARRPRNRIHSAEK